MYITSKDTAQDNPRSGLTAGEENLQLWVFL